MFSQIAVLLNFIIDENYEHRFACVHVMECAR